MLEASSESGKGPSEKQPTPTPTMDQVPRDSSLSDRVAAIHRTIQSFFPRVERIAVVLFDPKTREVSTFLQAGLGAYDLEGYSVPIDAAPSLRKVSDDWEIRVIDDLSRAALGDSDHAAFLRKYGFLSSLTFPVINNNQLLGFIFLNSTCKQHFTPMRVGKLRVYLSLISMVITAELADFENLKAAVNVAREFSKHRDEETSNHLERMARYCQLIAREVDTGDHGADELSQLLFRFAPLHDLGKIAIPDNILLKRGKLTETEFLVMQSHVRKGLELINHVIAEFSMTNLASIGILRNVIAHHHENWDGTGYPFGLRGDQISLEGRIARVADVFDALTSERPYKPAWSNGDAITYLRERSGSLFDPDYVAILAENLPRVHDIQNRFLEDRMG